MLGLGRDKDGWRWAVCGKHPLGKDYFRLHFSTPLHSAFAAWMDKGFSALPKYSEARRAICFWRFWAKGIKKGQMVCGFLKASSDGIGRPYPLLIVGTGACNGWEKNWEFLPRLLETSWQQIEYVASRRFDSLQELENAVRRIAPPGQDCTEELGRDEIVSDLSISADSDGSLVDAESIAYRLKEKQVLWIPLDEKASMEASRRAVLWGIQLKKHGVDAPQAFFLGGTPGKAFLVVFARSVNAEDFVHLWSVGESGFSNGKVF
ncbi:MAG: type VI secretion system-associated protein TagF [Desulfosalsimonadaceae bacterium]